MTCTLGASAKCSQTGRPSPCDEGARVLKWHATPPYRCSWGGARAGRPPDGWSSAAVSVLGASSSPHWMLRVVGDLVGKC
jgi:hypothetical protein